MIENDILLKQLLSAAKNEKWNRLSTNLIYDTSSKRMQDGVMQNNMINQDCFEISIKSMQQI